MKRAIYIISITLINLGILSCKKDNFNPPGSRLSGKLIYQGQPLQLQQAQCSYQLYQDGFGAFSPIANTSFAQEGEYAIMLYDGQYKLTIVDAQAPFMWKKNATGAADTLQVDVKGNTVFDVEVTPYYLLNNVQVSNVARDVTAKFSINKVVTDASAKNIEYVQLYFNRTNFVAQAANYNLIGLSTSSNDIPATLGRLNASGITDMNNITITARIPALPTFPTQNYFFARIGLKMVGIEKLIYSPVVKLPL